MLNKLQILAASAALNVLIPVTPLFASGPDEISFDLVANPKFAACLVNDPSGPAPAAHVTVSRGTANDVMVVELQNFKPGASFDLFTIQRSQLQADDTPDPNFKSFGLAWYQSDIHVGNDGKAEAVVKSILLDGIFGFDADPIPGSIPAAHWSRRPTRSTLASGLMAHRTPRLAVSIRANRRRSTRSIRPDPMP
jgi:hypothetical protein